MNEFNPAAAEDSLKIVYERFSEIHSTFARMSLEGQRQSLNRWNEAYNTFIGAIQTVSQNSQKHLDEAQRSYQTAAQDAISKGAEGKQLEQIYRNHLQLLTRTCEEAQKHQEEAAAGYGTALVQLREEAQAQCFDAYRKYLQSMKDAWATLDIDQVIDSTKAASK